MNSAEVAAIVARALDTFHYEEPPPNSGLLGKPWSRDRVMAGVETLRAALLPPRRVVLHVRELGSDRVDRRDAWVVAAAPDERLVVFEPAANEFALVELAGDGVVSDINVRGDLVGTFLAA